MKYRITYKVFNSANFYAEADTISQAYEYIKAIVDDKKIIFPNREETLSDYMNILSTMSTRTIVEYSNHVFSISVIDDQTKPA